MNGTVLSLDHEPSPSISFDMYEEDPWRLELNSDKFKLLCRFLNRTSLQADATLHYDVMSGGFRFSDERPDDSLQDFEVDLSLPLTTLLRFLWVYRLSVLRGTPRAELAEWWHSTKALAPNWSGFSPERCSENGMRFVEFCNARQMEREEGVDALERQLQERAEGD